MDEQFNFNLRVLSLELAVQLHKGRNDYAEQVVDDAMTFLNWLNENEVN